MAENIQQMRVAARCLQPLRTGNITVYGGDMVVKLKQQIQTVFDISVSNQILLVNKIRLENDRSYQSYLKNVHVAEPVHILDSRMCETCKVLVLDLINAFRIFDNMDFDQGGELSRQEIFVGLMNLPSAGEQLTEKEVMRMIDEADKDRNDSIDFSEFW
jgi:hypothetical protein